MEDNVNDSRGIDVQPIAPGRTKVDRTSGGDRVLVQAMAQSS
jgi:hypothetical protein